MSALDDFLKYAADSAGSRQFILHQTISFALTSGMVRDAAVEIARLRAAMAEIERRGEHTLNRHEGDAPSRATISAMCGVARDAIAKGV